ncbi:MAG: T9SS type A sorting domain-containing protein, partial [Candidatus Cloacimonadota bacterium]
GPLRLAYNPVLDQIGIGHYYNKALVNVVPETGAFISRNDYSSYGALIQVQFDENGDPIVLTMGDASNVSHIHRAADTIALPGSPSFFDYNPIAMKAVVTIPGPDYASVIDWAPTGIEEIEADVKATSTGIQLTFTLHSDIHIAINWIIERQEEQKKRMILTSESGEENMYLDSDIEDGKQYTYWITALLDNGDTKEVGPFVVTFSPFSTITISLSNLFPHPIQNLLSFSVTSSHTSSATIRLHSISGSQVQQLWNGKLHRGVNNFSFNTDAMNLSSGTFFLRITSRKQSVVKKIIILR